MIRISFEIRTLRITQYWMYTYCCNQSTKTTALKFRQNSDGLFTVSLFFSLHLHDSLRIRHISFVVGRSQMLLVERIASLSFVHIEYVEYTDGTIAPASSINANPPPARTANSPVQRTPGRIADYDPLSEARPSPYSARQAATTVIYTSDKGPGAFTFAATIAAATFL